MEYKVRDRKWDIFVSTARWVLVGPFLGGGEVYGFKLPSKYLGEKLQCKEIMQHDMRMLTP